jgi:photosystem II stability/assembly factor-like uncharacterized protein
VVDVSCSSASDCAVAVDLVDGTSAVIVTSDGGQTWNSNGPLANGVVPTVHQGLTCVHQTCVLAGADAKTPPDAVTLTSDDGGLTWSSGVVLDGVGVADGVQCPTAHRCVVIGQAPAGSGSGATYGPGVVLTSEDAGATWSPAAATGLPAANLYGLACAGPTDCWIGGALTDGPIDTGYALLASTDDGGATFTVDSLPATDGSGNALDFDAVLSLSCVHDSCVALAPLSSGAGSGAQAVLATP